MLRGVRGRVLRPLFITAGALLAGVLLLLMTDITLLMALAYTPYGVVGLITGAKVGQTYLEMLTRWTMVHQLICLIGGFLWLAATLSYARRSGDACLYCGRRDGPERWTSPASARRWGRIATLVALAVPVLYALTRFAWALGIPLGISQQVLLSGQATGEWISGLFLASFGLVGAIAHARPGAALGRGVPALDARPGRTASAHCAGSGPGRHRVGAAHRGRHRSLVRLVSDGHKCGSQRARCVGSGWPSRVLSAMGGGAGCGDTGLLLPAARCLQCVWSWRTRRRRVSIFQPRCGLLVGRLIPHFALRHPGIRVRSKYFRPCWFIGSSFPAARSPPGRLDCQLLHSHSGRKSRCYCLSA